VGAKFLADALMVNTSLFSINLSSNKIDDEGALCLAESFTVNRSLRSIQLCNNRIADIGATQLADAIEFNRDCGVSTINLNGNQVSAGLLDRIKSICKAKDSSKSKELSTKNIIQTAAQSSRKRKRKAWASKDDQMTALKEHIARREKNIAHLNDILSHAKPIVETIDLTTDEAEHATKRTRTESNVKSILAIMYEQNQKIVHIKKEKMDTEIVLESIRGEKNVVEADLKEVKEDLEDE
jgi:prophage DNA circulation protein